MAGKKKSETLVAYRIDKARWDCTHPDGSRAWLKPGTVIYRPKSVKPSPTWTLIETAPPKQEEKDPPKTDSEVKAMSEMQHGGPQAQRPPGA